MRNWGTRRVHGGRVRSPNTGSLESKKVSSCKGPPSQKVEPSFPFKNRLTAHLLGCFRGRFRLPDLSGVEGKCRFFFSKTALPALATRQQNTPTETAKPDCLYSEIEGQTEITYVLSVPLVIQMPALLFQRNADGHTSRKRRIRGARCVKALSSVWPTKAVFSHVSGTTG